MSTTSPLSRNQRRELERRQKKKSKMADHKPSDARVMAFRVGMGGESKVSADVRCRCGFTFRFVGIPAPDFGRNPAMIGTDQEEAPASTGPWMEGRCPRCDIGHRVRVTTVVIVEDEAEPVVKSPTVTASGLIIPGQ